MKKVRTSRGQDLVVPEAGERKGGRKKGVKNTMTTLIKEAMMLAINASDHSNGAGLVGYLTTVANERMDLMVGLIGRLLPIQHEAQKETVDNAVYQTPEEIRNALLAKGIPPRKVDMIMGRDLTVIDGTFKRVDSDEPA